MFRHGGAEGNARLTASTGVLLVFLLAVEGVTILFIRPLISVHVFVGLMLVPPMALKLAVTGWRFARYYSSSREYVRRGPPHPFMRVLVAPIVVLSTLLLLGTGVAMLAVRPGGGTLLFLHQASFVIWIGATAVHVLVYLGKTPRLAAADWRRASRLRARWVRAGVIAAALAAGVVFAVVTAHLATPWIDWTR